MSAAPDFDCGPLADECRAVLVDDPSTDVAQFWAARVLAAITEIYKARYQRAVLRGGLEKIASHAYRTETCPGCMARRTLDAAAALYPAPEVTR